MAIMVLAGTAALLLAGCQDEGTEPLQETVTKIIWSTQGGGQINFEITRDSSDYSVHLISKEFNGCDTVLQLRSEAGEPYEATDDVFEGRTTLRNRDWPPGAMTGTWTTITIEYEGGSSKSMKQNPAWECPLYSVYKWIGAPCGGE
jgi:hypothetical protein